MINEKNVEKAKNLIKKGGKIVRAQDDKFNRRILEFMRGGVLVGVGFGRGRDGLKKLDSGFNHVLARIAARNGVELGVDLDDLRKLKGKEKALVLGRLIQNIKFCRKAGCGVRLLNVKDAKDAVDFLISLGASTKQANLATK